MVAAEGTDRVGVAERLGFQPGDFVLEIGWGEDVDDDLRAAIEEHIGSDLLPDDADEVVEAVILWWREDDGDLVDALVDSISPLAEDGAIWVMTPKTGRPGHVEASDLADSAPTAGLVQTTSINISPDWMATKLVAPKSVKAKR